MSMNVLLIKTSSMGDIIHTLPALTDAGNAIPGIKFDWVVENSFAEIPHWHPLVNNVIPVALRQWRRNIFSATTRAEWRALHDRLGQQQYDLILDAQGLVKSAFLTYFTKGLRAGLGWGSAREALASLVYTRKCKVNFYQHAVVRMRSLFSQALLYDLPSSKPDFGLDAQQFIQAPASENYLVFLHGTTWATKQWPEEYWIRLANMAGQAGYRIKMSGGNDEEVERALRIAEASECVDVLPRLDVGSMAALLANAKAAVAVDTGFGHLSAAMHVPTVSLYGATNAEFTGALGQSSAHLSATFPCSPCYSRQCSYKDVSDVTPACYGTIAPTQVWMELKKLGV